MTAWIFTGVPGTGKGLFVHKILKPLFGEQQTPMRSLENIEEQFNLYMRTALFLVVDEFRMADAGSVGRNGRQTKTSNYRTNFDYKSNAYKTKSSCLLTRTLSFLLTEQMQSRSKTVTEDTM